MSRIAVCLFFIAILQTGIITFSQANDEETATKPTNVEPDKESEVETEEKSGVSSKTELKVEEASDVPLKKENKQTEGKEAKAKESKKENVTKKTSDRFLPDVLKGAPVEKNILFEFPKNIFGPVTAAGATIGEAVSKSIDTAKDLADGTFNFLRTSATNLFEK